MSTENASEPLALIVEDEAYLADIFSKAMILAGFETRVAPDGRKALEIFELTVPEIIILDLHIPHVSGREVLQFLKSQDRFQKTRIILATADARLADSLHQEAHTVLLKPVSVNHLIALAKRWRSQY